MHGGERRANRPIDVPDDRPADGDRRDIQVILIESATTTQNQLRTRLNGGTLGRSVFVIGDTRDTGRGGGRDRPRRGAARRDRPTRSIGRPGRNVEKAEEHEESAIF